MTDQEVRQAIKETIAETQVTAVVWPYNALSHELSEWPGKFRCEDGKTHGWIIKRASIESSWKNASRDRQTWVYDIWGFYGFRDESEDDNSDNEWAVIIDAVTASLKNKPTLELEEVEKHQLLQVEANTTIDTGEGTLHFARCRLRVMLCC